MVEQKNLVRNLKQVWTTICYPRPELNQDHKLSVVIFAFASLVDEIGQLGIIAGLLFGDLKKGSVFPLYRGYHTSLNGQ